MVSEEKTAKRKDLLHEITRKFFHLPCLIIPIAYHGLQIELWIIQVLMIGLVVTFLPLEIIRLNRKDFFLNRFTRLSEADKIATYVPTVTSWTVIMLLVDVPFFEVKFWDIYVAETAILATFLGDASAAVIGKSLGSHRLPFTEKKTIEGAIGGGFVTYLLALIFLFPVTTIFFVFSLIPVLIVVGMDFFEDLPIFLSDNVLSPIFTVVALGLLI